MKLFMIVGLILLASCAAMDKMRILKTKNPSLDDPKSSSRGKIVYNRYCLRCHGISASGDGMDGRDLKTPPTDLNITAHKKSANSVASHVIYGKGDEMPAFDKILTRAQIWDVANYVKGLAKQNLP